MFLAELRTLIAYSYTEGSNQNVSDEISEISSQHNRTVVANRNFRMNITTSQQNRTEISE
jgi:hypothetical protein